MLCKYIIFNYAMSRYIYFLIVLGNRFVYFLKILLKFAELLKPHSKAISNMFLSLINYLSFEFLFLLGFSLVKTLYIHHTNRDAKTPIETLIVIQPPIVIATQPPSNYHIYATNTKSTHRRNIRNQL